jgi:hypothetical protein
MEWWQRLSLNLNAAKSLLGIAARTEQKAEWSGGGAEAKAAALRTSGQASFWRWSWPPVL